jgi:hypothetical protein
MACQIISGTTSRFLAASLGLFLTAAASTTPAQADKRVALVIGNSAYQHVNRLPNPAKDAASMGDMLKKSGFDVVDAKEDVGNAEMRRMIRDFSDKVRDADVALVFYAGHGIEIDGTNYLLPVDTRLERDVDVDDEAVSLDRIVRILDPVKKLRLVILDACRDNPFQQTMKRSLSSRGVERGLAKVEPQNPNTLIAYAAKAGSTASDGDDQHSPFTTALLKQLPVAGQDIRRSLGYVRDEVLKSTENKQEPFVYGSLGGDDVVLVPGAARPAAPVPAQVTALDPNSALRKDYELAAQINTKAGWDAFLSTYPKGFYADLARAARSKLSEPAGSFAGRGAFRHRYRRLCRQILSGQLRHQAGGIQAGTREDRPRRPRNHDLCQIKRQHPDQVRRPAAEPDRYLALCPRAARRNRPGSTGELWQQPACVLYSGAELSGQDCRHRQWQFVHGSHCF